MGIGIAAVFIVFGSLFALGAFLLFRRSWRRVKRWQTTTGTVVDNLIYTTNNTRFSKPTVQFQTTDGRSIVFTSSVGSNGPPRKVGAQVKVIYLPADPEQADIRSFANLWLAPLIALFVGACFAGIGVHILLTELQPHK